MITVVGVERRNRGKLIPLVNLFTPYLYKHASGWLRQRSRLTSEPMTLQEVLGDTD